MFTSGTEDTEDPATATEEYEEELTAAEVLQKLEEAWINENRHRSCSVNIEILLALLCSANGPTCDVQSQKWR